MEPKKLKYISSACFVLGFLIPFLASNFVGMSLSAMPLVSVATIVLWIIGLFIRYFAYLGITKPPQTLSFRDEARKFHLIRAFAFSNSRDCFRLPVLSLCCEKLCAAYRTVSSHDHNVHYGPGH